MVLWQIRLDRLRGLIPLLLALLAAPLAAEAQRVAADPVARRFELLKQLVPELGRVAIRACCLVSLEPRSVEEQNTSSIIRETLTAARSAGVRGQPGP